MRAYLVLVATTAILIGCSGQPTHKRSACLDLNKASSSAGTIDLKGYLYIDQHGDFIRLVDCPSRSIRIYGARTAGGAAADALRHEIDNTLVLFNIHWAVDLTVRAERDSEGFILRILEVRSANRVEARPNSAFKPKLHRYAGNMAEKACHVASYALQFGLT